MSNEGETRVSGTVLDERSVLPQERPTDDVDQMVEEDLLVEEVSIDGMCGVY